MAVIKYKGTDGIWHQLSSVFTKNINVVQTTGTSSADVMSQNAVTLLATGKQDELISGTNIKTINNESLLGSGNITIQGGSGTIDQVIDSGTSASTNAVSTKAVFNYVTDGEYIISSAIESLSGVVSSHTSDTNVHLESGDKEKLASISGNVGTMAYEDTTSYSSATEVSNALSHKANANHNQASNTITAMTNYSSGGTVSPIETSDSLNQAIGKLETRFGGIRLLTISQTDYDNLQVKDSNTLYIITD